MLGLKNEKRQNGQENHPVNHLHVSDFLNFCKNNQIIYFQIDID